MKLRIARHTTDLQPIIKFYTGILGLEILGQFIEHEKYDGVFLGPPGKDWHLEFTVSNEAPNNHAEEDDLLVFYPDSAAAFENLKEKFTANGIAEVEPKNPYWKQNGITYLDPDGYRVVIVKANEHQFNKPLTT